MNGYTKNPQGLMNHSGTSKITRSSVLTPLISLQNSHSLVNFFIFIDTNNIQCIKYYLISLLKFFRVTKKESSFRGINCVVYVMLLHTAQ